MFPIQKIFKLQIFFWISKNITYVNTKLLIKKIKKRGHRAILPVILV